MKEQTISDELKYKFFRNQCTPEEHALVLQWMKSVSSKDKADFMDEHTGLIASGEINSYPQADLAFKQVEQKIHTRKIAQTRKLLYRRTMQVAATLILLITGYYSYMLFKATPVETSPVTDEIAIKEQKTEYGQQSNIKLSDGTQIKLNAGTKITYPEMFANGKRELSLQGQAFFNVARDPERPFVINTGSLQVTVLGTSFDVNSFESDNTVSVTVLSGNVRVSIDNQDESVILGKNEQLVYNKKMNSYFKHPVNAGESIAWVQGILRFNNAPLTDVFRKLERWYNVDIHVSGNIEADCTVSGRHKNEGLESVLDALKFSHGVQYTYTDSEVEINKIKCE